MNLTIQPFQAADTDRLVAILMRNGQYSHPEVEGPGPMRRASESPTTIFLVAALDGSPVGLVRAVYDGTRAMIHLLSVDPDHQRRGIGRALVRAVREVLIRRGAPTMSVTVTEDSAAFWQRLGFARIPVTLMLKDPI